MHITVSSLDGTEHTVYHYSTWRNNVLSNMDSDLSRYVSKNDMLKSGIAAGKVVVPDKMYYLSGGGCSPPPAWIRPHIKVLLQMLDGKIRKALLDGGFEWHQEFPPNMPPIFWKHSTSVLNALERLVVLDPTTENKTALADFKDIMSAASSFRCNSHT